MLQGLRACRWPSRWAGAVCLLALAGCGGGFFLGYDIDDSDNDDPPQVSLAISPDIAAPGAALRLVAAASDDSGVDRVSFFRVDGALSTLLVADESAPFVFDTELPDDATGTVQFFARAVDDAGQSRDSDSFNVTVDR